ncbi:MAG TPA: methylmalonyl-CoA mutase family protein, partial [Aggregatilineaceae bacterium]|nr:methylmalonyl-CoA mutase family protein [Aggregatilineaceae bacterium]
AAVLGGAQSLHTNSMDEALALPSEHAVTLALRTQQVIAHETGVANTLDPLGGSYFLERLTDEIEEEAYAYFRRIDDFGGVIPAIEAGFFQQEIADAAARFQAEVEVGERQIVGVNAYAGDEPLRIPILEMDPQGYERQIARLADLRASRDADALARSLDALRAAARGDANLMPHILDAARADATLQEIMDVLRDEFGLYHEKHVI